MIDNIGSVLCPRCFRERARQMSRLGPMGGIDMKRFCRICRARVERRLDSLIRGVLYNN